MDTLPPEILLIIGTDNIETYRLMLAIPKFARAVTVGIRLDMMEASGVEVKFMQEFLYLYTLNKLMLTSSSNLHKSWERKYKNISLGISYGGRFILTMRECSETFNSIIEYGTVYVCNELTSFHYGSMCSRGYSTNCGSRNGLNAYGINECLH